jgi:hypothetical protein
MVLLVFGYPIDLNKYDCPIETADELAEKYKLEIGNVGDTYDKEFIIILETQSYKGGIFKIKIAEDNFPVPFVEFRVKELINEIGEVYDTTKWDYYLVIGD